MRKERNRNDERNYRKTTKSKRASQAKGITLVALVITIIIIIILATVTINMAFGDDGIIKKVKDAKTKTEDAAKNENQILSNIEDYIDTITGRK